MASSQLAVLTAEGNRLSQALPLPAGQGARYIHAVQGQRIVVSDPQQTGFPGHLILKRSGKNLLISLPDEDAPRLVVYDFYSKDATLQGIGPDGRVHDWVTEGDEHAAGDLDDDTQAFAQLSSNSDGTALLAPAEQSGGAWKAMAAFAGLLGLGGIVRSMQNQHSGPGESAPPAPLIHHANDEVGLYTGVVAAGGVTDDASPLFNGSGGQPGALITFYADGAVIGTTTVNDDGSWTLRPEVPLAHGVHTFTATASSANGLTSAMSAPFTLNIDLIAPERPLVAEVLDNTGSITGGLTSGDFTDDTQPQFTGTAEPGALLEIMQDGVIVGSVVVMADGNWSWQPQAALADGQYSYTFRAIDAAGNIGLPSLPFTFIVDTVMEQPVIASVMDAVAGGVQGALPSDGVGLTNDSRPVLSGQAKAGSLVTLFDGDLAIASLRADSGGSWLWQYPVGQQFSEGKHTLTVKTVDAAGNNAISTPFVVTVDTVIAQPVITSVTDAVAGGVEGALPADGTGLTNDSRPVLSGRAEAGSLVTLFDGDKAITSVTAGASGQWSWQYPAGQQFTDGVHTLTVRAVDPAGNASSASASFVITVDTAIAQPVIASITDAVAGGVEGALPADGVGLTNDSRPVFSGQAEAGSLVTLFDGDKAIASVTANASGQWSWQYPAGQQFTDGVHTLTVRAVDPAGNTSSASASFVITVDTAIAQPVIGSITDAVAGGVEGALPADGVGLTNDSRPVLSGQAKAGSLVTLFDGDKAIASVTANASGQWSWQYPAGEHFADGVHTLTARAVDAAGNSSSASASFVITVDTAIAQPVIGSITDAVAGGVEGALPADGVGLTNDSRPALSGQAEAGSLVTLFDGGTAIASVTADASGQWSWQYPAGEHFADGVHTLTVQAKDKAGNLSLLSAAFTITVDTTPPTVTQPAGNSVDPTMVWSGSTTNDQRPQLTGHGEVGSLVTIYQNATAVASFIATEDGDWVWQPANNLADGTYQFQVSYQDSAGNRSELSSPVVINIDTTPPSDVNDIGWDGEILTITFDGSNYQPGDRIALQIDGESLTHTLTEDDLTSGKLTLPWSSAEKGNFDALVVTVIDSVDNESQGRELDKNSTITHQENFETLTSQRFTNNQVIQLSGFELNVINAANGGILKGIPTWELPSPSLALTFFTGTKVEMVLPDHDSDYISFTAGDFNGREQFTVVFYDSNGEEVDRQILTPSDGLTQHIKASVPFGMTFSKVSLELNTSGVWIDDIVMGKTHYGMPSSDDDAIVTTAHHQSVAEVEQFNIDALISDVQHEAKADVSESHAHGTLDVDISPAMLLVQEPEPLFNDLRIEPLNADADRAGDVTLEQLIAQDGNPDDWNVEHDVSHEGEVSDTLQETRPPLESFIEQSENMRHD